MVKTVKITDGNRISVVALPAWNLREQERAICADCTEIVRIRFMSNRFAEPYVMIVDESGYLKKRPINLAASCLYSCGEPGIPIAGDVIFGVQEGPDVFPPHNAEKLFCSLMERFPGLKPANEMVYNMEVEP